MKQLTVWSLLMAAILMQAVGAEQNRNTMQSGVLNPQRFTFSKTQSATIDYLLYLPKDYTGKKPGLKAVGSESKRWPLMLFLHGAGERGSNVWKVAVHGPPSLATNQTDFPFIIVSPQCPEGEKWSRDVLLTLLEDVTKSYSVDSERVYLTGLSMGGYGTWDLGLSYPEKFAAIVPICGGGEMITVLLSRYNQQKLSALKTLGIWAFHGAKDPVVPLSESQRMVDAAKRAGVAEVKFTVYPEAEHNSWTETYKNPELYEWLLTHRRSK